MSTTPSPSNQRGRRETSFIESSGGLLTEQLLYKLRDETTIEEAVQPETFAHPGAETLDSSAALESHIGEVWEDLLERWDEVSRDNEIFGMDVSSARTQWILKLFEALDFEPEYQQANLSTNGLEANLSHLGWPRTRVSTHSEERTELNSQYSQKSLKAQGEVPTSTPPVLHSIQPDDERPLDDGNHRGAVGRQKSPHDELQTYLNASEDLQWSIVTDGLKLRLLRDYYHTYTRGYVEFDLENIFTNRNYSDFRALYRLCHASRFVESMGEDDSETPLEQLYQVALATGVKVGQDLQENVVSALETLGNGFLDADIKAALDEGGQDAAEDYYQDLLYVVYRLLFLMFTEQRGMMSERDSLYTEEYSVTKLSERAERRDAGDRNTDLWEGLKTTFHLVGEGEESLGIPGYNGGLFDDDNLGFILDAECPNEKLLSAVHGLTHIEQDGYQQRISYADLGVEEIGAVYESLLEFTPQMAETAIDLEDRTISSGSFYLDDRGMDRKETGSYYTDPGLVDDLIQSSLKPVLEDRVNEGAPPDVQEQQLLDITVCDPTCGSGAFLIAANNFLGQRLAEIRSDSPYPDEQTVRQARRAVVQHCLYGVDLNPMAVELAKVSLWINSAVEDKPLSFLDHRIKQGNSLIGATPELMSQGVPVDAYETSKGRDWHNGNEIRKRVREENDALDDRKEQVRLDRHWGTELDGYVTLAEQLDDIEEQDIGDVHEKERIYQELRQRESFQREKLAYDVWTAAFYWPLDGSADEYPTPNTINRIRRDPPAPSKAPLDELSGLQDLRERASRLAEEQSFFHWPIEFADVYTNKDGFDCILGNPPWDRVTVEEQKFFAVRDPEIADSSLTQSERDEKIAELEETNPDLYEAYQEAVWQRDRQTRFIKESGRYQLTSKGILNLYAPFAEVGLNEINARGRTGIVLPTGIATDANTQEYFRELVEDQRLVSLSDFQNKEGIFPDVHRQFHFCLLTLVGEDIRQDAFELAFGLIELDDLQDQSRRYSLTPEEIELINPNTKNCPTFESEADADLTVKLYRQSRAFKLDDGEQANPWSADLHRMYNMSDDSGLFRVRDDFDGAVWNLEGNIYDNGDDSYLPIYEAKLIHQFDHRFSTYRGVEEDMVDSGQARRLSAEEKDDPSKVILPRYWLAEDEYKSTSGKDWHVVFRRITNSTNERTVIATVIPGNPTVHTINHISGVDAEEALLLVGLFNSYTVDYVARQKVSGTELSQFIIRQLPIPSPQRFNEVRLKGEPIRQRITELSLRLLYTANDLSGFADEAGYGEEPFQFTGDAESREAIRTELEALVCHVYGIEASDIDRLFSTFEQVNERDQQEHGYYRTRENVREKFLDLAPEITDTTDE